MRCSRCGIINLLKGGLCKTCQPTLLLDAISIYDENEDVYMKINPEIEKMIREIHEKLFGVENGDL